jgi:hypothetical protein
MEVWKPIPLLELYEASDAGRIRSLPRVTQHYTGKPIVRGGRVLAGHVNPRGYVQVSLSVEGRTRTAYVHALVAAAFLGPRPDGMVVRHLDGEGQNNAASNLAYGTHQENSDDMERHGTVLRGDRHGCAKLTADQVREIRELAKRHSRIALARMFRMSDQQISNIVLGHQWRGV